jgi:hypothetical protein
MAKQRRWLDTQGADMKIVSFWIPAVLEPHFRHVVDEYNIGWNEKATEQRQEAPPAEPGTQEPSPPS